MDVYIFQADFFNTVKMTSQKLVLVSAATQPGGYFDAFKFTAQVQNIDTKIVGWGKPWSGWLKRLEWLNEEIEKVEDNRPILITDSYDVFFQG